MYIALVMVGVLSTTPIVGDEEHPSVQLEMELPDIPREISDISGLILHVAERDLAMFRLHSFEESEPGSPVDAVDPTDLLEILNVDG